MKPTRIFCPRCGRYPNAVMPWGKKIRGKPGLCRGVWMFAGVP